MVSILKRIRRRLSIRTRNRRSSHAAAAAKNDGGPPKTIVRQQLASPVSVLGAFPFEASDSFAPADVSVKSIDGAVRQDDYVVESDDQSSMNSEYDTKVVTRSLVIETVSELATESDLRSIEQHHAEAIEEFLNSDDETDKENLCAEIVSERTTVDEALQDSTSTPNREKYAEPHQGGIKTPNTSKKVRNAMQDSKSDTSDSRLSKSPSSFQSASTIAKEYHAPKKTSSIGSTKDSIKWVLVHAGVNKGKEGTIVGQYDKRTLKVEIEGVVKNVRMSSVSVLPGRDEVMLPDIISPSAESMLNSRQESTKHIPVENIETLGNGRIDANNNSENPKTESNNGKMNRDLSTEMPKRSRSTANEKELTEHSTTDKKSIASREKEGGLQDSTDSPSSMPVLYTSRALRPSNEVTHAIKNLLNTATSSDCNDSSTIINTRVSIHAGVNKGKSGMIVGKKDKRTYKIEIEGAVQNVRMTSVRILLQSHADVPAAKQPPFIAKSSKEIKLEPTKKTPANFIEAFIKNDDQSEDDSLTELLNGSTGTVQDKELDETSITNNMLTASREAKDIVQDSAASLSLMVSAPLVSRESNRKRMSNESTHTENNLRNSTTTSAPNGLSTNINSFVSIHAGVNKGKSGTIVGKKDKRTYKIEIEGAVQNVRMTSVRILPEQSASSGSVTTHCDGASNVCRDDLTEGADKGNAEFVVVSKGKKTDVVEIEGGNQMIKRTNNLHFLDRSDEKLQSALIPSSSSRTKLSTATMGSNFESGNAWKVANSKDGGNMFGTRTIVKIRLALNKSAKETTFLHYWLENRTLITEISLNDKETAVSFDRQIEQDKCRYELISAKVQADGDVNAGSFYKPKCVRLFYAQVRGPNLASLSLQEELLKIADFSALSPRKVMSRLELLQSPACTLPSKQPGLFFVEAADICLVDDRGYVGCGFICERKLEELYGGNAAAKRIIGIQVRIIVPIMGIFKGMLCRKQIISGPPIQLPSSMLKVPASTYPDAQGDASLLICKNGIHPMSGTMNEYIGRKLNHSLKPPPKKGFKDACRTKALSNMVLRLWEGMKVPEHICLHYAKRSLLPAHRNHAWIVGLADPTNCLPAGHIFVPGLMKGTTRTEIFVTRSPCNKPVDGRILPLVTTKPPQMSSNDWEWLNTLSFGAIIFANPKRGMTSIPEQIADGDLDGDLYLVCWDDIIVSRLQAIPLSTEIPSGDDTILLPPTSEDERDVDWFDKAQHLMVDAGLVQVMGKLIGKLYTISKAIADENKEDGGLFMAHPDAIAFAKAYNQALEFGKHGGKVSLPIHLHERLPSNLREHVIAAE